MIYLGFPYGSNFGWGVLGKEITLALSRLAEVRLLAPPDTDQRLNDEFEFFELRKLLSAFQKHGRPVGDAWRLDGPVIQAAIGRGLEPFVPQIAPPIHVGYAVFEESVLPPAAITQARRQYRHLAAASGYCAEVLRKHGLTEVSVVPHGVDTNFFCPREQLCRTKLWSQLLPN